MAGDMSGLTVLRIVTTAGAGLGLLWVAISLLRVSRAYPPPPPFLYGNFVSAILPVAITLLCGAARLMIDQDNPWLTALVIVAMTAAVVCGWRTAISLHRRVPKLVQANKDLDGLRRVVEEAEAAARAKPPEAEP